ncbi:tyrosinase HcTyr2-like, partial [Convolutriloba macropyga]|uniref:tyrosinase HcTyr2-like n=1 Tax=Convolutriloba macropyga TaxID=536237 RepID=UPI003F52278A
MISLVCFAHILFPKPASAVPLTLAQNGKKERNPLLGFKLPLPLPATDADAFYAKPEAGYQTTRYPFSGIQNPEAARIKAMEHNRDIKKRHSCPDELFLHNFRDWLTFGTIHNGKHDDVSLLSGAKRALDNPDFNLFSNRSSSHYHGNKDIWRSIEVVHDHIHLAVGGYTPAIVDPQSGDVYFGDIEGANGDMGDNETAAFDPIFFVHHSNIDRLFWVWQKKWGRMNVINISKDLEDPGVTPEQNQGPTVHQTGKQVLDLDTGLYPFQDELGVVRKARDCVHIETQLNYTYSIGSLDKHDWPQSSLGPTTEQIEPIKIRVSKDTEHEIDIIAGRELGSRVKKSLEDKLHHHIVVDATYSVHFKTLH